MKKIIKISSCLILIYLFASPFFASSIIFGQEIKSCNDVKQWEFENWPSVFYCTKPIIKDGDNRYFVFVNKPNNNFNTEIGISGISPSFSIEQLNPNLYHWDITNKKLVIDGNGALIIHGDGNQLTLSSNEPKFRLYGVEDCTNLVIQTTLIQEQLYSRKEDKSTGQLLFLSDGTLAMLFSMFKTNEGFDISQSFKDVLISMYNENDGRGAAVALLEGGKFKRLLDLGGQIRRVQDITTGISFNVWTHDAYSTTVMNDVQNGVYGTFDEAILVRLEPPNTLLTDALRNHGYWKGYLVAPRIGDIAYSNPINNDLFGGMNVKRMIVTAETADDVAANKLMYGFSKINPPQPNTDPPARLLYLNPTPPIVDVPPSQSNPFAAIGTDPRFSEYQGQFTWSYSKIDVDNIVFSPSPATLIDDTVPLGIKQQILSEISDTIEEMKEYANMIFRGEVTGDEIENPIQTVVDDFDGISYAVTSSAELTITDKDSLQSIISLARGATERLLNEDFSENSWLNFDQKIAETLEKIDETTYNIMYDAGIYSESLRVSGWWPTTASINLADQRANLYFTGKNQWGSWAEYEYTYNVGETLDDVADELSEPMNVAKFKYGAIVKGIAFSFIFSLGPYLRAIGEKEGNSLLYAAGTSIKAAGIIYTIYNVAPLVSHIIAIFQTYGFTHAAIAEIGVFFTSILTIELIIKLVTGIIIALVITVIVALIMCIFYPSLCASPCQVDPAYSIAKIALDKHAYYANEREMHYVVYGLKECRLNDNYMKLFYHDNSWIVVDSLSTAGDKCISQNGECWECTIDIMSQSVAFDHTNSYLVSPGVTINRKLLIPNDVPSDYTNLAVCDPDDPRQKLDISEGKCIFCDNKQEVYDWIDESNGGDFKCEVGCDASPECDEKDSWYSMGYADDNTKTIYASANQIRGCDDCIWSDALYDSYIKDISVKNVTYGDSNVRNNKNIEVYVSVKNTGKLTQGSWYVGVEFWNVSDYNDPWNTRDRNGRINTFYNGMNKVGGCDPNPDPINAPEGGKCPANSKCELISESNPDPAHNFDPGETITLKCQVPASFYSTSSGNQRVMFWVHERDLGQDADNDGNVGYWWNDALSRSYRSGIDSYIDGGPALTKVKIVSAGDINEDGIVDIFDIVIVASAFGSSSGDTNYKLISDVDQDGSVNIYDIVIVALDYGKTY